MLVRYEEVVEKTKNVLKKVWDFIDLNKIEVERRVKFGKNDKRFNRLEK
jgi:hypothetical protein